MWGVRVPLIIFEVIMKKGKTVEELSELVKKESKKLDINYKKVHESQQKIRNLKESISAICKCETLEPKTYCFSGSHDETAFTDTWDECIHCGKRYNQKTKYHGYYSG